MTAVPVPLPPRPDTSRLGAQIRDGGTRFGLWAPRATRVELALVDDDRSDTRELSSDEQGVWTGHVPGVSAGQRYGYRVHDDSRPQGSAGFDPGALLLDPYARAITGEVDYRGPARGHLPSSARLPDPLDAAAAGPLSVVVADGPPATPLAQPTPMARSIVYELHVKGFTQLHPDVPEHLRGSYAGLAHPAVVQHLLDLGVTAVELLPVHHFVSEPALVRRGLTNLWGYNSVGFFAPHAAYASSGTLGQQVTEFKAMVSALHAAGLEVLLDVVYNHTGEGGVDGPTLSFRGIDQAGYYRLSGNPPRDHDVTGCGNSVDTSQPQVRQLVLDSLRYWVGELGVDGFRFDLATTLIRNRSHEVDTGHAFLQAIRDDPLLGRVKLIAEPWDVGAGGYRLAGFGPGWSEWNDRFRNDIRDFWRGSTRGVRELALRLSGSADVFDTDGRAPSASVNYVTAHDGFTLRDLVSYENKHNEANGEGNRDGSDDNRSDNCGHEGETTDPAVNALRRRQSQNLMATQLLAAGVPMITAGDELGRTQQGNNNAYCQDSPISWLHWDATDRPELTALTRLLLALRREHLVFSPDRFRHGTPIAAPSAGSTARKNLAWFSGNGAEMTPPDWADGTRQTLGMYVSDDREERDTDDAYLVWFHRGVEAVTVELPDRVWASTYTVVASSATPGELPGEKIEAGTTLSLPGRTVAVLQVD